MAISPAEIASAETMPVLEGSGLVYGQDGDLRAELTFTSVVIAAGAHITAEEVTVENSLELRNSAVLEPQTADKIQLRSGIALKFSGQDPGTLPRLDLGAIGSEHDVVPSTIEISITELPNEIGEQLIVQGRRLGNCEEWKAMLIGLPDSIEGSCKIINSPWSKVALGLDDEIGLFLVKKKGNDDGDDESNVGLIVGITVGALVVVMVAIGAFIFLRKKKAERIEVVGCP
jgi:hypothetical protein